MQQTTHYQAQPPVVDGSMDDLLELIAELVHRRMVSNDTTQQQRPADGGQPSRGADLRAQIRRQN